MAKEWPRMRRDMLADAGKLKSSKLARQYRGHIGYWGRMVALWVREARA